VEFGKVRLVIAYNDVEELEIHVLNLLVMGEEVYMEEGIYKIPDNEEATE